MATPYEQLSMEQVGNYDEEGLRRLIQARLAQAQPTVNQQSNAAPQSSALVKSKQAAGSMPIDAKDLASYFLDQYQSLSSQGNELFSSDPDYSKLQEYARARSQGGDAAMLNALAAQYAGEGFAPLQAQYLKRAASAQDPLKLSGGILTPDGSFLKDPAAERDARARLLMSRADLAGRLGSNLISSRDRSDVMLAKALAAANATRKQQGGTFALPDGTIVSAVFDPDSGKRFYQNKGGMFELPHDARPTVPSAAGPLSTQQFFKLTQDLALEESGVKKLDRYLETQGDANVGLQRLADQISGNIKTLFAGQLDPKELSARTGQGQLQALLGLFRTDIVGPGVMTEYDAQRVLMAIGGDFTALQNPQVVRKLLGEIMQDKQNRINLMKRQVDYNSRFFPGVYAPAPTPPGSPGATSASQPQPGKTRIKYDAEGNQIQ